MDDYRKLRRYRQQKLTKQGFYLRRQQRSRARLRAEQASATNGIPAFEQIFSSENLVRIYYKLQQSAGHAPGPDGIKYDQLGHSEVGQLMRQLSQEIIRGTYSPSTARSVQIKKANGRGHRTLTLRSILYRIVAAALAEALGPYFDRMFLPGSHGFRAGRGPWTMLLHMEQIMIEQQRFVIAQDDIKQAFDHLPNDYIMGLLSDHIDDERLLILANKILCGHEHENRTVGIDQGSALSPLMLNVALHHALDLKASENAAHPPWLRYADNLVYLVKSVHEGATAIQAAQALLHPIGMTLKGTDGKPVDLRQGQTANLLGFNAHWAKGQIQYDLPEETWKNLQRQLSPTHTHSSSKAATVANGWIDACGPAFEGKPDTPILNRILEAAAEAGHRELSPRQLKQHLQSARDRWAYKRNHAHNASRERTDRGTEPAPLATDRTGHLVMSEAGSPQAQPAAVSAPF